jgi:aerobic carbon-monoxide dehydrogenase large subunit
VKTATAKFATAGSGMKWAGRSIRRLEDPALVSGRGRFTADLPAMQFVRFVRSPIATGRILRISAPDGVPVIGAADLGARPIRPMLHKFNYRPIEQPILAQDVVRFVGEPVVAVFAPSAAEAEDMADRVEIEIAELPSTVKLRDAMSADAPQVHDAGNVVVDGRIKTDDFDAAFANAHRHIGAFLPAKRNAARSPRRARGL